MTTVFGGSRRQMLQTASAGFGYLALAGLAARAADEAGVAAASDALTAVQPMAPKPTHFAARAKRVIFLCMQGGPSHVDTFDYKPQLIADAGKLS